MGIMACLSSFNSIIILLFCFCRLLKSAWSYLFHVSLSIQIININQCYSVIVAFTTAFFLVVAFNEQWIISTIVFGVCVVVFLARICFEYLNEEFYELVIKSVYCIFIYGLIAYISEIRSK